MRELKEVRRGRIAEYAEQFASATYHAEARPWIVPCDVALPCATQNEIGAEDARRLIEGGVTAVCEGANMPTELDAVSLLTRFWRTVRPAKAANAGGVAVSGLEMSQNSARLSWTLVDMERQLEQIMSDIHGRCVEFGREDGDSVDYVAGANIAGFRKVAEAMLAFGVV